MFGSSSNLHDGGHLKRGSEGREGVFIKRGEFVILSLLKINSNVPFSQLSASPFISTFTPFPGRKIHSAYFLGGRE